MQPYCVLQVPIFDAQSMLRKHTIQGRTVVRVEAE